VLPPLPLVEGLLDPPHPARTNKTATAPM